MIQMYPNIYKTHVFQYIFLQNVFHKRVMCALQFVALSLGQQRDFSLFGSPLLSNLFQ